MRRTEGQDGNGATTQRRPRTVSLYEPNRPSATLWGSSRLGKVDVLEYILAYNAATN